MALDAGKPSTPPADIASRKIPLKEVEFTDWRRIHSSAFGSCFYSPNTANRFSSPACPILYVGDMATTVFWETFWDDLGTVTTDKRRLPEKKLTERNLCQVSSTRKFKVFNARQAKALQAVSANAAAFTADYHICQQWAVALLNHPQKPEGILYPSVRHHGGVCLALFEARTACSDMTFTDLGILSEAPPVLAILTKEKVAVLP